jgi:hypothetical protein
MNTTMDFTTNNFYNPNLEFDPAIYNFFTSEELAGFEPAMYELQQSWEANGMNPEAFLQQPSKQFESVASCGFQQQQAEMNYPSFDFFTDPSFFSCDFPTTTCDSSSDSSFDFLTSPITPSSSPVQCQTQPNYFDSGVHQQFTYPAFPIPTNDCFGLYDYDIPSQFEIPSLTTSPAHSNGVSPALQFQSQLGMAQFGGDNLVDLTGDSDMGSNCSEADEEEEEEAEEDEEADKESLVPNHGNKELRGMGLYDDRVPGASSGLLWGTSGALVLERSFGLPEKMMIKGRNGEIIEGRLQVEDEEEEEDEEMEF